MSWLVPEVLHFYEGNESNNLKTPLTRLPTAFSYRAVDQGLAIAAQGQGPVANTPFAESGVRLRTSFEDWYYRIHLIPAALPLGNVSGDLQREVVLWNAFLEAVTLEDFGLTPGQGITVTGGAAAPFVLAPLEDIIYTLSISANGPSTIDAVAAWVIDGETYEVPITGQRSLLFGFRPDWKLSRLQDTYEWLNSLTQTYSGYEQVRSLREEPRRHLEYAFRLHQRETRLLDTALFGWTGRVFGLPWWPDRSRLTQDAPAGASVLYLDTAGRAFAAGGAAVLHRSASDYDALDIDEVFEDRIVLRNSTTQPWPAGSKAYPVVPSIPGADIETTRVVPTHVDGVVRFTMVPTQAVVSLPDEPAPATYRGYELYTGETNWRSPLGIQVQSRRKDVDGVTGPLSIRRKADFPLVVRGFSWLAKTRAEIWSLLALLARRQGRRYPMWMPSGTEDFKLLADIEGGQNSMLVERSEYARVIGNNEARRDVVLLMRGQPPIVRRILAVEDEGADSLVTFTEAFPGPVARSAVKRVSYLGLYRLGSDSVTLSWVTGSVAEVDVNLVLKKDRAS